MGTYCVTHGTTIVGDSLLCGGHTTTTEGQQVPVLVISTLWWAESGMNKLARRSKTGSEQQVGAKGRGPWRMPCRPCPKQGGAWLQSWEDGVRLMSQKDRSRRLALDAAISTQSMTKQTAAGRNHSELALRLVGPKGTGSLFQTQKPAGSIATYLPSQSRWWRQENDKLEASLGYIVKFKTKCKRSPA